MIQDVSLDPAMVVVDVVCDMAGYQICLLLKRNKKVNIFEYRDGCVFTNDRADKATTSLSFFFSFSLAVCV